MVDPPASLDHALKAEKSGFDCVWLGDHLTITWNYCQEKCSELWVSLAIIGANTRRVMILPGVTDPYRRHPSVLAQATATLDQATNGRAGMGIGAGEAMNLVPFGISWTNPVMALRESIIVMRKLWQASIDNPASFQGKLFSLDRAFLMCKPVQKPSPPIYVGAQGRQTLRVVGELGDGWLPWIMNYGTFIERLGEIEDSAKKAGRRMDEIDVCAFFFTALSDNREEEYMALESVSKMALVLERKVLEKMGLRIGLPQDLTVQSALGDRESGKLLQTEAEKVPREAVEEVTLTGPADDCISKIERFVKAGATQIVVMNFGPDPDQTFTMYKNRIIPYVKEQFR
jgi:alkanesulfonate monooxygenase SsuD/methylene tetrahydromethanopterin reductase-like flavin-dependent oxidoreductase (luciferase family)